MKKVLVFLLVVSIFLPVATYPIATYAQTDVPWPMAGANPQRTSWISETIPGDIKTKWVKPIEPYIQQKVQLVAAEGKIFISTAKGLYAINSETGAETWTYPTELPLGHSPTYDSGSLYVGGFDRMIHKVNAANGQLVWKTLPAEGGFHTNPLVVDNKVIAGNRDGNLYAYDKNTGSLSWKFTAGGQILNSPAYKDGVIFFGANDAHAYAVNSTSGSQVWKSAKLHGQGWHSWWPVIYGDNVIFTRSKIESGRPMNNYLFPTGLDDDSPPGILGTEPGNWVSGEKTVNISTNPYGGSIPNYLEENPHYKNAFFLNRATGIEVNFDLDSDSKTDGAPISTAGDAGTRYPPIVSGHDNVIYFRSITSASGTFAGAMILGWKVGTPFISLPFSPMVGIAPDLPEDEFTGISAAGNKLYWNHCCDRFVGAVDISKPNTFWPSSSNTRQWRYVTGANTPPAPSLPLGYHNEIIKFYWNPPNPAVRWGENDKAGPTIYKGKLYVPLSNAVVAFSVDGIGLNAPVLPTANTVSAPTANTQPVKSTLTSRLEKQVQAIVNTGHLKPSFSFVGGLTFRTDTFIEDFGAHYWHNPQDVFYVLLRALPYLTPALKQSVITYLQSEYANFAPYQYSHIGWFDGVQRDPYIYPPNESQVFDDVFFGPKTGGSGFKGWSKPPHNVYAIWQAAKNGVVNPATAFSQVTNYLNPSLDEAKVVGPHVRNAYLTGLKGYIELAKLAGQPLSAYQAQLTNYNNQLTLRANEWSDFPTPKSGNAAADDYFYTMITAWNFMYLTPEVVTDLTAISGMQTKMNATINKYEAIAPYWMFAHNEETQGENGLMLYQQTHSLFQAKALVKKDSYEKLAAFLDTPIVPVGDLYYIDNLVSAINATGEGTQPTIPPTTPTPNPLPGDINSDGIVNIQDFTLLSNAFGTSNPESDINKDGTVNILDFSLLSANFGQTI